MVFIQNSIGKSFSDLFLRGYISSMRCSSWDFIPSRIDTLHETLIIICCDYYSSRILNPSRIESYEFSEFIWLTAFIQIIPFARNATEHFTSRRISPSWTMNHNISPILWFILNCFLHWLDVNASCIYAMDFISGSGFSKGK